MARMLLRAACILALIGCEAVYVYGQTTRRPIRSNPAVQVSLKQQLQMGLKCRRPVDFEFVDHIVKLVDEGKLSLRTVNISYDWSVRRSSFRPIVYFQRSITLLAKRDGVIIDFGKNIE